jgi:hypothetical protein
VQLLVNFLELRHDRIGAQIASRNHIHSVWINDHAAFAVHDEHGAVAHARVFQPRHHAVERNHRSNHAGEMAIKHQRHGHHHSRAILAAQRKGSANPRAALHAGGECMFQSRVNKGILVRANASGVYALGVLPNCGDVENVRIGLGDVLQHPAELRRVGGIADVLNPACQREQLPLALQLFV